MEVKLDDCCRHVTSASRALCSKGHVITLSRLLILYSPRLLALFSLRLLVIYPLRLLALFPLRLLVF